jgi:hypothetical protein
MFEFELEPGRAPSTPRSPRIVRVVWLPLTARLAAPGDDDEIKPGFSKANGKTIGNLSLRRCSHTVRDPKFTLDSPHGS